MSITPVNVNFVSASDLVHPVSTGDLLLRQRGTWLKTPPKPEPVLKDDGTVDEVATAERLATYESAPGGKPVTVTVATYQVVDRRDVGREINRVGGENAYLHQKVRPANIEPSELGVVGEVHYDPTTRRQIVRVADTWKPVQDFLHKIFCYKNGQWVETTLEEIA